MSRSNLGRLLYHCTVNRVMQRICSGSWDGAITTIHSPVCRSERRDFKLHMRYPEEGRMGRVTSEIFAHVPSI